MRLSGPSCGWLPMSLAGAQLGALATLAPSSAPSPDLVLPVHFFQGAWSVVGKLSLFPSLSQPLSHGGGCGKNWPQGPDVNVSQWQTPAPGCPWALH